MEMLFNVPSVDYANSRGFITSRAATSVCDESAFWLG